MWSLGALTIADVAVLAAAALVVGLTKTTVSSAGGLAVVLFAVVIPARESTGALLPLLIVGDLIAISVYSRHADWRVLARLLPGVLPGLALGAWFISWADDSVMRRCIGVVLLSMGAIQLAARNGGLVPERMRHPIATATLGVVAGFSTTTANAAGPVASIYLLMAGLSPLKLLGTAGWFFLAVNLCKVPLVVGLGLVSLEAIKLDMALLPVMAFGAWLGCLLARSIDRRQFETLTLVVSMLSAAVLLV